MYAIACTLIQDNSEKQKSVFGHTDVSDFYVIKLPFPSFFLQSTKQVRTLLQCERFDNEILCDIRTVSFWQMLLKLGFLLKNMSQLWFSIINVCI